MKNPYLKIAFALAAAILCLGFLVGCCKHVNTELIDSLEATCTEDGYSGDMLCKDCGKIIETGESIPAKGHVKAEASGVKEASCTQEGYTGDIYCAICGELIKEGKVIPKTEHTLGDLTGYLEATCAHVGYSGDIACTVCGQVIVRGDTIEKLAHVPGPLTGVSEPTCAEDGYTGDIFCEVCGENIIEKLPHTYREVGNSENATCLSRGYSGDLVCEVCGHYEYGNIIECTDHAFKDHVCTICGWMTPGLYLDEELVMSWEDLKGYGYITVDSKGQLKSNSGNFQNGRLVVGEDVTYIDGNYSTGIDNSTIGELWLPRSITQLGSYITYHCSSLKKLVLYCQVKTIPHSAFTNLYGDAVLETIILPDCVETIEGEAFNRHPYLTDFHWPANLKYIGRDAFRNCGLSGNLVLPDGVETLEHDAFCGTNIQYVTLPASLTEFRGAFDDCGSLLVVDGSQAIELKSMAGFCDCPSLATLILPPNLESMESWYMGGGFLRNCPSLNYLEIPDSVRYCTGFLNYSSVGTIVFPSGLIDIGGNPGTVKEIRYRGSEQQWKMTTASTLFSNIKIQYNWDEYISDGAVRISNSNTAKGHQSDETQYGIPNIGTLAGTYGYVYVDDEGSAEQFAAVSSLLKGAVAVCNRGELTFSEKANAAAEVGAIAVIIVDPGESGFGWMNLSGAKYKIPVILVHSSYKPILIEYGTPQTGYAFDAYTGNVFICD